MKHTKSTIFSEYQDIKIFDKDSEYAFGDGVPIIKYLISSNPITENKDCKDLKIIRLNNKFSIISSGNDVQLLAHEPTEDGKVKVRMNEIVNFSNKVVSVCTNWPMSNSISLAVIVFETSIMLFSIDVKSDRLIKKGKYNLKNINCLNFVNSSTIFALTNNNTLSQFDCSSFSLTLKSQIKASMHDQQCYGKINNCALIAQYSSVQDYPIFIVYSTFKKVIYKQFDEQQQQIQQTLIIKQFIKKKGSLEQGQLFIIRQSFVKQTFNLKFSVVQYKKAIFLELFEEIIVINKQHESYYILDSIMQKYGNNMVFLHDGKLFVITNNKIEMAHVELNNTMCNVDITDVIYYSAPEEYTFFGVIPVQSSYLCYFFNPNKSQQLKVVSTLKIDAIDKLVGIVKKQQDRRNQNDKDIEVNTNNFKGPEITELETLGRQLGIGKQQFYIQLWQKSPKLIQDIRQKLFLADNPIQIKKQVVISLRHRKINLYDLSGIFIRLVDLIKIKLKTTMNLKLLKQYIKIDFLLRKIKIQPQMDALIGYHQYIQIKNKNIMELLAETILDQKSVSNLSLRQKQKAMKSVLKNQLIMKDVLAMFRFILLDNYESDLISLLKMLKDDIAYIFKKFSYLLPNYPYEFQFKTLEKIRMEVQRTVVDLPQKKQKNSKSDVPQAASSTKNQKSIQTDAPQLASQIKNQKSSLIEASYLTSPIKKQKNLQSDLSLPAFPTKKQSNLKKAMQVSNGIRQPKLFCAVRQNEWDGQITIQNIYTSFSPYHPTSLIDSVISQLALQYNFDNERLTRHGLIKNYKKQYVQKAQKLSGINLYLKVLQFANNNSITQQNHQTLPDTLVNFFREKNKLQGQDFFKCRFYSKMHLLLLRNNVDNDITINRVVNLSDEEMITLFFLCNKSKINLLFNEVKLIYEQISEKENMFYKAINSFVRSQNCSKVELSILTKRIKQMGKEFQETNQQLISIILDGYSSKLTINQGKNIHDLIYQDFKDIELNEKLNERIVRIFKICSMSNFFAQFYCQNQILLLVQQQGNILLSRVLENYFVKQLTDKQIQLGTETITLQIRNMLNVLLYIVEQLYSDISEQDVLLLFGDRLIDYSLFNQLMQLLQEQQTMQTLDIDVVKYASDLISQALNKIFQDKTYTDFNEAKDHLYNILKLHREQDEQYFSRKAQIELCEIVSSYNCQSMTVTPYQITHTILPKQITLFINKIILNCYQKLTNDDLIRIFKNFKIINFLKDDINEECIAYITLFTKTLLNNNLSEKSLIGVNFLLNKGKLYDTYSLTTQCLLNLVGERYSNNRKIGMNFIEYYVISYYNREQIEEIFRSNLSTQNMIMMFSNSEDLIPVHQSLFYFKNQHIRIHLRAIEKVCQNITNSLQFFRTYHFLISTLRQPYIGFNIKGISYDYHLLQQYIEILSNKILSKEMKIPGIGINFNEFSYKFEFFKGLVKVAQHFLRQKSLQNNPNADIMVEYPDFNILTPTKIQDDHIEYLNICQQSKVKFPQIYKIMKRYQKYLQENYHTHTTKIKKVEKYRKQLKNTLQIQQKERKQKQQLELERSMYSLQPKNDRTMPLKRFVVEAQNLSSIYNMKLRDITSMIWETESRFSPPKDKKSDQKIIDLFSPINEQKTQQSHFYSLFDNNRVEQLNKYDQPTIIFHLKTYYNSNVLISNFLNLLQLLKIGQQKNRQIVRQASRITTQLNIKDLFPFQFYFYKPQQPSPKKHFSQIFKFLRPTIKYIITPQNQIIIGKIIYSSSYDKHLQFQVYIIALQKFIQNRQLPQNQRMQLFDEYIRKLCGQTSYVQSNFDRFFKICQPEHSKDLAETLDKYLNMRLEVVEKEGKEEEKSKIKGIIKKLEEKLE